MDTMLLTFKSHSGNLELNSLTLMAITASLTKLGDGIEPNYALRYFKETRPIIHSIFSTNKSLEYPKFI